MGEPRVALHLAELVWLPLVVLVQLVLTTGLALVLSALTVHFRDVRDILSNVLTLWFFATPIIYSWRVAVDESEVSAGSESVHAPGRVVSGDSVPSGECVRPPLVAAGAGRARRWRVSSPGTGCSIGCVIRSRRSCERHRHSARSSSANVTKIYRRYGSRQFATLKSALTHRSLLEELKPNETFTALSDVSLRVPVGCTFGLVGRNGSGKSTALKLVAGITKPTTGTVTVRGRISALIELGAGFHPEISGRENVFINGIMLGLSKREIERRFDEIVEFAELADFIDEPVKTYSSGMYMRLGFSVAIHVDPDVLLVDEVLAVGDEGFTHKCLDKFADFKRRGKTVLLVTHSLNLVERFCDEAAWLDAGRKRAEGDPYRVIAEYVSDVERQEERFLASSDDKAQTRNGRRVRAQTVAELPSRSHGRHDESRRGTLGLARGGNRRCRTARRAGPARARHSFRRSE